MTSHITRHQVRLLAFAISFIGLYAVTASAQGSLLKIGTIKDYPATGLMTGCGNLYFHQRGKSKPTDADFLFLARGDGSNAWMNLNGRDVRLRQIKTISAKHKLQRYNYRYGNWQITIAIEDLTTKAAGEADPMYQMKITFQKGHSVRVIHAAGDSDC
jgi:hypothetical protein